MATLLEAFDALEAKVGGGDLLAQFDEVEASLSRIDPNTGGMHDPVAGYMPRADDPRQSTPRNPDRIGDTLDYVTRAPRQATTAFAKGLYDQADSPTRAVLPDWVPGKQLVATVGDTGGLVASALGTGAAAVAGAVGEVAGGSRTGERALARDLLLMGQVAVPEMAGVSSTARIAGQAGRAATKPVTPLQESARAADDLGVTPALGMNGKLSGWTAAVLEKVPFAGTAIQQDALRAVADVETAFARTMGRLGAGGTPDVAGATLQGGMARYVTRFRAKSNEMYDEVAKHLPGDTRVPLSNAEAMIADAKAAFDGNPELAKRLGLTSWDGVIEEARNGGISWSALREFRTSVGEAMRSTKGELGNDSSRRLGMLYSALSDDMEAAARAAGPDAVKAWEAANGHYRTGAERIGKFLDKDAAPERVFEAFVAMARSDRANSDVRRMRGILGAMTPTEKREVAASIVERLGRARPGQQNAEGDVFSPAVFLTNWNGLSKEAKVVLLPESVRIELNKLAKVAERVKDAGAERNTSNTGSIQTGVALTAGSFFDLGATAAAVGGATLSANAMTSLPFLRALNAYNKGHPRAITAMAKGKGPFKADAATVLRLEAANSAASPSEPSAPSETGLRSSAPF